MTNESHRSNSVPGSVGSACHSSLRQKHDLFFSKQHMPVGVYSLTCVSHCSPLDGLRAALIVAVGNETARASVARLTLSLSS